MSNCPPLIAVIVVHRSSGTDKSVHTSHTLHTYLPCTTSPLDFSFYSVQNTPSLFPHSPIPPIPQFPSPSYLFLLLLLFLGYTHIPQPTTQPSSTHGRKWVQGDIPSGRKGLSVQGLRLADWLTRQGGVWVFSGAKDWRGCCAREKKTHHHCHQRLLRGPAWRGAEGEGLAML